MVQGPGEYEEVKDELKGGHFGKFKPKSDIEWQMYRASQLPAPGDYEIPTTLTVSVR